MPKQRTEVIDGKEYVVTTLPKDKRLTPSATKKRQLFGALTHHQKGEVIAAKKRAAAKKRRAARRRRRKHG